MKNLVPILTTFAACMLLCLSAYAQTGYSVQLAVYSSPASPKFFVPISSNVSEIKIDASTYLYVIDGFPMYGDADKVRKDAAGKGFPDAIALKTSSSRMPALKVKEYTGPRDGTFASAGKSESPAAKPATTTPAPPPPSKTQTPPPASSYSSTTTTQPGKTQTPPPTTTSPSQPYSSSTYGTSTTQPSTYGTSSYNSSPSTYGTSGSSSYNSSPSTYGTSSYGTSSYGATSTYGNPPAPTTTTKKADYNQNFEVQGSVVRELLNRGSLESAKVKAADLPEAADLIFFDFDKAILRPSGERELGRLSSKLQASPDYTLEIRAHTDNVGTDVYNNELSDRRAKSVQIFMLKKGISANRLSNIRAYGETRPIAANTLPDGSDNPMGRQINRRVELILKDFTGRVVEVVSIP